MAVPTYDKFYRTVLDVLSDGKARTKKELYGLVSDKYGFSDAERAEMLPSGKVIYIDRIGWAITYLHKASLLDRVARATYALSESGKDAAESKEEINNEFLGRYPSFREFYSGSNSKDEPVPSTTATEQEQVLTSTQTPEENLFNAISTLKEKLIGDLLEEIRAHDSDFFERLVVDVIQAIYGGKFQNNATVTQRTHDGGIDGIIKQDRLGFNNIYVQAKKWESPVERPEIQKFAGAMQGFGATNGAFITSSTFTSGAKEYVQKVSAQSHIILIDGVELAKLMIEYGVGVSVRQTIEIKKVDMDYFNPDAE